MPASEAEMKTVLKEWDTWFGKVGVGVVDGGNPTQPLAKNISSDGKVSDVPMGSMVSGYSILKADSLDEAVELAKGCPVLKDGACVSVLRHSTQMVCKYRRLGR